MKVQNAYIKLSVVVAAHNRSYELSNCLTGILEQQISSDYLKKIEIIIAGNHIDNSAGIFKKKYSNLKVLKPQNPKSVPYLRSWGIREANGDIIALTEDHCVPAKNWVSTILSSHNSENIVVGGAVENASKESITDWAVYFFEYSAYMNPIRPGWAKQLPGNNVSYSRKAVNVFKGLLKYELWDSLWHEQLLKKGVPLTTTPRMIVYHKRSFATMKFWYISLKHGRNYGVSRRWESQLKKMLWITCVVFIPFLMTSRIFLRVVSKQRYVKEFFWASPLILWFCVAWTYGEIIGCVTKKGEIDNGWGHLD